MRLGAPNIARVSCSVATQLEQDFLLLGPPNLCTDRKSTVFIINIYIRLIKFCILKIFNVGNFRMPATFSHLTTLPNHAYPRL